VTALLGLDQLVVDFTVLLETEDCIGEGLGNFGVSFP